MEDNPVKAYEQHYLEQHTNLRLRIGVAIDGSTVSEKSFKVGAKLCNLARGDRLYILHISDSRKKYLCKTLLPGYLEKEYDVKKLELNVPDAEWYCREKKDEQSTCAALRELAEELMLDILVVGSFGRKGEKIDMLGTVSDYSLRRSNCHVCIVKSSSFELEKSSKFLIATDGSTASKFGFTILLHQLIKPDDELVVLHNTHDVDDDSLNQDINCYKQIMKENNINGSCIVEHLQGEQTAASAILAAARKVEADFLVMGIQGYGKEKLGSVSDEVVQNARCSTIIIKDPHEIIAFRGGASTLQTQITGQLADVEIVREDD